MAATILLVEDERKLRDLVRSYLERAGFTVLSTSSGAEALSLAASAAPDLLVLDLGLPDVSGETVAREVRATGTTPILMLTAKNSEEDRVRGLELGADDYVTKPFSPRELVLRVQAILRRGGQSSADQAAASYGGGTLVIDEPRRVATVRGSAVELTPTEWGVLAGPRQRARPRVLAIRAHQPGPRLRIRRLRAHHRLARQEPAAEDRAGSGQPRDRQDRSRRGVPAGSGPR